ncbi:pre-mRNA-splicing factor CWC22 homolog isoform X2 [Aricia agestis]|uniref:pre-mRNA-splicing factor CWC22 homolog isoform X2 n=1 Tax=Aricia agestis TaxID=91739 RepID=UPI001C20370A|nr:pre-mRNA-splicing factor CWC22 homolog isoform X2 [Aricia agestis]
MEYRSSKRIKDDKYSDNEASEEKHRDRRSKRRRSRSRTPKENRNENRSKRRHSKSPARNDEKQKRTHVKDAETKPDPPVRKAKETDMLNTRTGGAYIPPARLRMMQAQITDKSSVAYQRLAWEALKKSIHGHINKINVGNIGIIIKELLKENIVRGRGLLCRSVIQAQAASPTFTNVYAALVSAVNSRFPNIGELLLKRLVIQFKRGFKRNDKATCISSASFIAHLVNQKVAHEILALELLTLLVETPTDDSVEVAIAFLKECGQKLTEVSSKGCNAIFEMLRNILHEGQLDKRVQYMIEVMFQVWKDGFKDHPAVIEELELVPEEEQFTHLLTLDDATDSQDILNVFKFDDKYEENEQKYKTLSKEILGTDAESGEEDGSDGSGSDESEDEEDDEEKKDVTIIDKTETNLVALRRTIYLTINSSLDFEECAHKLMKMQLKPGQEIELCHMFLDCCAEQRTYEKFYGLLAQRFCNINRIYIGPFEEIFKDSYATAHRLDTNRLRNVSKFFAHLLFTDSISWEVLECVKLNEEDTTSSSRIYIKILFQELAEYMGLKKLNDRLKDPTLQGAFSGVFPRDNPKNTRFSINFFTSIGLGGLTDELREHLKQMPKNVPPPVTEINIDSETSSDSSSSSSSSSSSDSSSSDSSDTEEQSGKKTKGKKGKKDNAKKPQTPEPEEAGSNISAKRWGHDGFYDTYGQGAKRAEPNRSESFRLNEREHENSRRNKYQKSNGDGRKDREKRDRSVDKERRERYDDRNKCNEGDTRSRDKESGRRKERDEEESNRKDRNRHETNHEQRHRRNYEDNETRHKNDSEDETRRRRDEENDTRKRDDDNDNRRRRDDDNNARRERDDGKDTRRKRDDENDARRRQDSANNTRRGQDEEIDIRRKQDDDDHFRRRRNDDDHSRQRRDDENGTRRRRDDDSRRRHEPEKNRETYNVPKRMEETEDTTRRKVDKSESMRRRERENEERSRTEALRQRKDSKKEAREIRENNDEARQDKKIHRDMLEHESPKDYDRKKYEEQKVEKYSKSKDKRKNKKQKIKQKSDTDSSNTSSESDSSSDSDTGTENSDSNSNRDTNNRNNKKKVQKTKKRNSSDSDTEQKNFSGRYWDNFDIESRNKAENKINRTK